MHIDEISLLEELVDRIGNQGTHAEHRLKGVGARSQMRDRSQILKAVFLLLQRIIRCGSSLHLNLLRLNLERLLHLRGCDKLTRHDDCRADV